VYRPSAFRTSEINDILRHDAGHLLNIGLFPASNGALVVQKKLEFGVSVNRVGNLVWSMLGVGLGCRVRTNVRPLG